MNWNPRPDPRGEGDYDVSVSPVRLCCRRLFAVAIATIRSTKLLL
jgi:hypothetical protein